MTGSGKASVLRKPRAANTCTRVVRFNLTIRTRSFEHRSLDRSSACDGRRKEWGKKPSLPQKQEELKRFNIGRGFPRTRSSPPSPCLDPSSRKPSPVLPALQSDARAMRRKHKRALQGVALFTLVAVFAPSVGLWALYRDRYVGKLARSSAAVTGEKDSVSACDQRLGILFDSSMCCAKRRSGLAIRVCSRVSSTEWSRPPPPPPPPRPRPREPHI
uniref:Uncharacterized protein n=1 Tax=Eptatretus burgeri TaxID=7764 RepID=A0A8C4QYW4_EPTBU